MTSGARIAASAEPVVACLRRSHEMAERFQADPAYVQQVRVVINDEYLRQAAAPRVSGAATAA